MNHKILLFLLAFVCSFILTWLVRKWALKESILDIPNGRSSHTIPTPRGGGIAIAIVWFVALVILQSTDSLKSQLFFALLNSWILTPLAFIGIIWLTNLFNFLDGIDGYISTEIIFIGVVAFILFNDILALLIAVIVLGFLFWNWQKAKIFIGDVGSTLLGFTIAVFAIHHQNSDQSSIILWMILTSLFWMDATVTLWRRFRNKEQLSQAHRKHAYQRIVQAGFSHQKTVLYGLCLNLSSLLLVICAIHYRSIMLILAGVNILIVWLSIKWIDQRKPFEKAA
jgi:Fuc2NAc and GlcNAc transferase